MTKSLNILIKKLGRGSPIHNDFSFTPSSFPQPTESVEKKEKTEEVGGVLGTIETYTKVPTPSGRIDKRVEKVKIKSYLLFFSISI